jgi:hypothetical protein
MELMLGVVVHQEIIFQMVLVEDLVVEEGVVVQGGQCPILERMREEYTELAVVAVVAKDMFLSQASPLLHLSTI